MHQVRLGSDYSFLVEDLTRIFSFFGRKQYAQGH